MTPDRAERFLQREVGDPKLRVRWRSDIERFEIGRRLDNHTEWFYVCTDGESGYRPVDMRTVRKVISLDTWRRQKALSLADFINMIKERKLSEREEHREILKYRIKHEARYIKKAAEKDGLA
jgi:hypothetical protein